MTGISFFGALLLLNLWLSAVGRRIEKKKGLRTYYRMTDVGSIAAALLLAYAVIKYINPHIHPL